MDLTQPHDPGATAPHLRVLPDRPSMIETQPTPRAPGAPEPAPPGRASRPCRRPAMLAGILLGVALSLYLLVPGRTTVLLLGVDRAPQGTLVARSDTMILYTSVAPSGYVGMLSLPRDLWVNVPGVGPNRINTAHFFGEASATDGGPALAVQTVAEAFGLEINGYARVTFDGIVESVDALGGVVIDLPEAMSGYTAGAHRLDGKLALAFVRDRAGSDDFSRMQRAQLFLKAVLRQSATPWSWPRLPLAAAALLRSIDSNLPAWECPRLALALLRAGADGIDGRTITRAMVRPFTTDQGAQVLDPNWAIINPVLMEMFGQ
jgi:LCP family protein required for cell wall assembly